MGIVCELHKGNQANIFRENEWENQEKLFLKAVFRSFVLNEFWCKERLGQCFGQLVSLNWELSFLILIKEVKPVITEKNGTVNWANSKNKIALVFPSWEDFHARIEENKNSIHSSTKIVQLRKKFCWKFSAR